MRGIFLADVDMPSSCAECLAKEIDRREEIVICTCCCGGDVTNDDWTGAFNFRPNWCPLKEVDI